MQKWAVAGIVGPLIVLGALVVYLAMGSPRTPITTSSATTPLPTPCPDALACHALKRQHAIVGP